MNFAGQSEIEFGDLILRLGRSGLVLKFAKKRGDLILQFKTLQGPVRLSKPAPHTFRWAESI